MPKPTTQPRRTMAANLAARILAAISEQRLAARFIESYAKQFERAELIIHKERNRELEFILEKEILLAMLARIAQMLEESARERPRGRTREKIPAPDANRTIRRALGVNAAGPRATRWKYWAS